MTENYWYYDPTSDCNTCISQYDYDRLSEENKQKYKRMDIPTINLGDCKSIEEFTLQQVIDNQERVIKEQKEDIERLQAQLDREIKINRKMKSALEKYADEKNWDSYGNDWRFGVYKDFENDDYPEYTDEKLAQQVLKEIDNKE